LEYCVEGEGDTSYEYNDEHVHAKYFAHKRDDIRNLSDQPV